MSEGDPTRGFPPDDLQDRLAALKASGRIRRLLLLPGPGDVAGTYRAWRENGADPRRPSISYAQQSYELAQALDAEVLVLCEAPPGHVPAGPVRFRHHPAPKGRGLAYRIDEWRYMLRALAAARAFRADALIVQRSMRTNWLLGLAPFFGIHLVYSLHNLLWGVAGGDRPPPGSTSGLARRLRGWGFRRAAGVVTIGPEVTAQAETLAGAGRANVLMQMPQYNARFADLDAGRRQIEAPERLICLGRVEAEKGVFILLDAFAELAAELPKLSLEVIGEGQQLEAFRSAIAALPPEIAARVEAPGRLDGAAVFERLLNADLMVCPTTSGFLEGMTKTPIEAALCGLPSLMTRAVPTHRVLGEAALVIAPDAPGPIVQAIRDLAAEPSRLQAMAAATKAHRQPFFDRHQAFAMRIFEALERAV